MVRGPPGVPNSYRLSQILSLKAAVPKHWFSYHGTFPTQSERKVVCLCLFLQLCRWLRRELRVYSWISKRNYPPFLRSGSYVSTLARVGHQPFGKPAKDFSYFGTTFFGTRRVIPSRSTHLLGSKLQSGDRAVRMLNSLEDMREKMVGLESGREWMPGTGYEIFASVNPRNFPFLLGILLQWRCRDN